MEENILHLITELHEDGCHIWGIIMLNTCTIVYYSTNVHGYIDTHMTSPVYLTKA